MSALSNKAIIIAVGLFVTIAITSGILYTVSQIKNIYKGVYETDISITRGFDEYDKYDNTVLTGIDMLNAANKYVNSPMVTVKENDTVLNTAVQVSYIKDRLDSIASLEYNAKLERINDYIIITFKKK